MRGNPLLPLTLTFAVAATAAIWTVSPSRATGAMQSGATVKECVEAFEEPHHHQIIDNLRVRALEVEVPPHEATLLHRHDKDYVYVVLGEADITNAVVGKPEVKAHLADTAVNFVEGPISHIATNVGNTPFRNFTLELKRKQGDVKIYFPSVDVALADTSGSANPDGSKNILETDELRVSAIKIVAGQIWTPSKSNHPRLFMRIDEMKNLTGQKEPKAPTFPEGMLVWVPGGRKWSYPNYTKENVRLVWLDFKN
jgi:hypothetical protein